ncbi:MAG: hypothetical protein ABJC33_12580 [Betaproteobacteria bacterium]
MVKSPRPLRQIIAADAVLAGWQERRAREETLTTLVRRHLPRQLGERVRATQLGSGEIELVVAAGAVAAALRQRAPDLLAALIGEGAQCNGIKVRVQVAAGAPPEPKIARKALAKGSLIPLAALTRGLPDGSLKAALARLLRRVG